MNTQPEYKFRKAEISDVQKLEELIVESSKTINGQYYEKEIINAAIGNIWIVDEQLILDHTYWLVENQNDEVVACGGWSKRNLLFGNSETANEKSEPKELNPETEAAKIRAFFVHPDYVRKGIGKELLNICENAAKSNGFKSLELIATLSGEKLYKTCGFNEKSRIQIDFGKGILGEAIEMRKEIG